MGNGVDNDLFIQCENLSNNGISNNGGVTGIISWCSGISRQAAGNPQQKRLA